MAKRCERAYEGIRREILSHRVVAGDRLVEVRLAERLGCGRTAVREALHRLDGEGMVARRRTGGYVVRKLLASDLWELSQLREILEVSAVKLVAEGGGEVVSELGGICELFDTQLGRGYTAGACEADLDFHRMIIEGTGNRRLADAYRLANIPLFHHQIAGGVMNDYQQTSVEHRAIVDRIAAGDGDGAAEALRRHIRRGAAASQGTEGS